MACEFLQLAGATGLHSSTIDATSQGRNCRSQRILDAGTASIDPRTRDGLHQVIASTPAATSRRLAFFHLRIPPLLFLLVLGLGILGLAPTGASELKTAASSIASGGYQLHPAQHTEEGSEDVTAAYVDGELSGVGEELIGGRQDQLGDGRKILIVALAVAFVVNLLGQPLGGFLLVRLLTKARRGRTAQDRLDHVAAEPVAGQVQMIPGQPRQHPAGRPVAPPQGRGRRDAGDGLDDLRPVLVAGEGCQLLLDLGQGRVGRRQRLGILDLLVFVLTMTLGFEVGCNLVLGRPFIQGEGAKIRHRPRIGSARTVVVVLAVIVAVTGHGCWLLWGAGWRIPFSENSSFVSF